ncbi:MAG: hypothetical protein ABIS06_07910 [Vicinamibacterales bacterium]
MRRLQVLVMLCVGTLAFARAAAAQEPDPAPAPLIRERIAPFVFDARVPIPRFKQDGTIASGLGVETTDLPVRGIGLLGGAHVYPLRRGSFALGFGAEIMRSRASKTRKGDSNPTPPIADGPSVKARWSHFSPQGSLNFGKRDGYSYLTVGMGKSKLTTELDEDPQAVPESSVRTLNYGGGARWFIKDHLAFNLDLRFYSINAEEPTPGRTPNPKMRLLVFGAGVSIR